MPNWPQTKQPHFIPSASCNASHFEKRLLLQSQFREMKRANKDKYIIRIIQQSTTAIAEALCVKASKKLARWGHIHSFRRLVDILITKGCTIPVRVYDMLIHVCCSRDKLEKAFSTFLEMELQDVVPTKQMIRRIIGICKKRKNGVSVAEQVWDKMVNAFNIVPDIPLYGALIGVYAFHRQIEKTEYYFQEVLKQTDKKSSESLERICGHMFRLYGSVNEKEKCKKMEQFMIRNNIRFDAYAYTNLIRAYLIYEDIEKSFEIFEEIQINQLVEVNYHILGIVAAAYLKGIALSCRGDSKDWKKIHKYLRIMSHDLPLQYPDFMCTQYKKIVFDAVLWKYLNNWKNGAVAKAFEQAYVGEKMDCSYWTFWQDAVKFGYKLQRPAIDFHNCSHICARYILRRIFCFETHNLRAFSPLFVICGKGNHRTHSHLTIKETIVDELHGWKPQVRTEDVEFNEGLMSFNEEDVVRFLNTNQNVLPSSKCFSKLTYDEFHKCVGTKAEISKMSLIQRSRALTPALIERRQRKITKLLPKLAWAVPAPGLTRQVKMMKSTKEQPRKVPVVQIIEITETESNDSDERLSGITSTKSAIENPDFESEESESESQQSDFEESSYYTGESQELESSDEYNVFEDKEYKSLKRKYDHKSKKYDLRHKRYLDIKREHQLMVMKYDEMKERMDALKKKNKELSEMNEMSKEECKRIKDEMDEYDRPYSDDYDAYAEWMNLIHGGALTCWFMYSFFFNL